MIKLKIIIIIVVIILLLIGILYFLKHNFKTIGSYNHYNCYSICEIISKKLLINKEFIKTIKPETINNHIVHPISYNTCEINGKDYLIDICDINETNERYENLNTFELCTLNTHNENHNKLLNEYNIILNDKNEKIQRFKTLNMLNYTNDYIILCIFKYDNNFTNILMLLIDKHNVKIDIQHKYNENGKKYYVSTLVQLKNSTQSKPFIILLSEIVQNKKSKASYHSPRIYDLQTNKFLTFNLSIFSRKPEYQIQKQKEYLILNQIYMNGKFKIENEELYKIYNHIYDIHISSPTKIYVKEYNKNKIKEEKVMTLIDFLKKLNTNKYEPEKYLALINDLCNEHFKCKETDYELTKNIILNVIDYDKNIKLINDNKKDCEIKLNELKLRINEMNKNKEKCLLKITEINNSLTTLKPLNLTNLSQNLQNQIISDIFNKYKYNNIINIIKKNINNVYTYHTEIYPFSNYWYNNIILTFIEGLLTLKFKINSLDKNEFILFNNIINEFNLKNKEVGINIKKINTKNNFNINYIQTLKITNDSFINTLSNKIKSNDGTVKDRNMIYDNIINEFNIPNDVKNIINLMNQKQKKIINVENIDEIKKQIENEYNNIINKLNELNNEKTKLENEYKYIDEQIQIKTKNYNEMYDKITLNEFTKIDYIISNYDYNIVSKYLKFIINKFKDELNNKLKVVNVNKIDSIGDEMSIKLLYLYTYLQE